MCWRESASDCNRWPRMTGVFISRPFPSPTLTAAISKSVPATCELTRKTPSDECRDEEHVEKAVGIWKSQTQRFPDSHRPGCYCFFFVPTKTKPRRKCYPCPRSIVLPMSQSTHAWQLVHVVVLALDRPDIFGLLLE